MEESIRLLAQIKIEFGLGEVDLRTYSPLTLAFVGDCIYDLIIRTVVVECHNASPNRLHKEKSRLVKAQTQALMGDAIQSFLTPEEQAVFRRGRNAKSYTTAKNATVGDYRKATALEALYGYLYLDDRMDRLMELIKISLNELDIHL